MLPRSAKARRVDPISWMSMLHPAGQLWVVASCEAIEALHLAHHDGTRAFGIDPSCKENPEAPLLLEAKAQLEAYGEGRLQHFDLPMAPRGTPFQRKVWHQLEAIPFGKTQSYSALAQALGSPKSVRAVASACGKNPIPILIPCHRVIAKSGALGGFAYGLEAKRRLLRLEGHEA